MLPLRHTAARPGSAWRALRVAVISRATPDGVWPRLSLPTSSETDLVRARSIRARSGAIVVTFTRLERRSQVSDAPERACYAAEPVDDVEYGTRDSFQDRALEAKIFPGGAVIVVSEPAPTARGKTRDSQALVVYTAGGSDVAPTAVHRPCAAFQAPSTQPKT